MKPPPEVLRARRVVGALSRLDAAAMAPDLDPGLARRCLALALAPLTVEALSAATWGPAAARLPASVGVVAARGVFTATVEWAALYATAGIRLHLKAPSAAPEAVVALGEALAGAGLPVTASTHRDLSGLEALVVFGGDGTGQELAAVWPQARVQAFGHKVSAALVDVPPEPAALAALAAALATDHVLYDTQGCMAPVAVLARGDAPALAQALHEALAAAPWPRGALDPVLGPEWRRRVGLARVLGRAWQGADHAVLLLPPAQLQAAALPRMAVVHPVEGPDDLAPLWDLPLSGLAVQGAQALAEPSHRHPALRICAPGTLQTPPFPRRHEGVDMLGCVLRPEEPR